MASDKSYNWQYCKIGGVARINITSGKDIAQLGQLDKKLWTVLSCPVTGLEFDEKTLKLLDSNGDGKIRVNEVVAAADWLTSVLKDANLLLKQEDKIALSAFNIDNADGKKLHDSAKQILKNLGVEGEEITLAQASDSVAIFAKTALNGDGIITEQSTDNEELKGVIKAAIDTVGALDDRSGLKGIDAALLDKFYAACADYKAWKDAGTADLFAFGDDTAAALDACNAVKDKIADYFMRCKLAAFNADSAAALDVSAARIGEISNKDLAASNDEISAYPIARVTGKATLTLDIAAINPAWQAAFDKVKTLALAKVYPGAAEITEAQWNDVLGKFAAYSAWNGAQKGAEVESLGLEKIEAILSADKKAELAKLIDDDKALEAESNSIDDVEKFLRYYKNFYKLLKNFVTFTDFYARDEKNLPVFQAGTLFVDQRSTELCIKVTDMGKQGPVGELSGMYILYCECTAKDQAKMNIAAVLTDGDVNDLRVGKNAVFYDRKGVEWDAVITKIVDNPISVRQAFWAPYRKLAQFVYDKINKNVAEKNANAEKNLIAQTEAAQKNAATAMAKPAAPADAAAAAPAAAPAPADAAAASTNKVGGFDIAKFAGIFAAIGMAVGFIASALVTLAEGVMAHWYNGPLLILAIILLVSGPSMFLAWQKLRKRNLAPVLNANGWAINSRILVNIPFGTTFTSLAKYPKVAAKDPYPNKKPVWLYVVLAVIIIVTLGYVALKLTGNWHYIPEAIDAAKSWLQTNLAI